MKIRFWLVAAVAGVLAFLPASSALLSKTYQFKTETVLELGAPAEAGLRLDTVRFSLPDPTRGRTKKLLRVDGQVEAEVAISNSGSESRKVGIAIALFDANGRLVGVASGGSKLIPVKPERQSTYSLVFSGVNGDAHRATSFQISVEAK